LLGGQLLGLCGHKRGDGAFGQARGHHGGHLFDVPEAHGGRGSHLGRDAFGSSFSPSGGPFTNFTEKFG